MFNRHTVLFISDLSTVVNVDEPHKVYIIFPLLMVSSWFFYISYFFVGVGGLFFSACLFSALRHQYVLRTYFERMGSQSKRLTFISDSKPHFALLQYSYELW